MVNISVWKIFTLECVCHALHLSSFWTWTSPARRLFSHGLLLCHVLPMRDSVMRHEKKYIRSFFVFWMCWRFQSCKPLPSLSDCVCVCVLSCSQRGLKGDHWCQRVLSRQCEMYTKQKPQSFRGSEDKAHFCFACSIFIFWLLPQRSLYLSALRIQRRLHLVLMNLGM